MFKTTDIYPNRLEDKDNVERLLLLLEEGNKSTKFYSIDGNFLFEGYERVVYGDHGPYVEFNLQNIRCKLTSKFGNHIDYDNMLEDPEYYYYWLHPITNPEMKVYLQVKPVHDKLDAPTRVDGKPSKFNRKEGYADYRRGFFYVDPFYMKVG